MYEKHRQVEAGLEAAAAGGCGRGRAILPLRDREWGVLAFPMEGEMRNPWFLPPRRPHLITTIPSRVPTPTDKYITFFSGSSRFCQVHP